MSVMNDSIVNVRAMTGRCILVAIAAAGIAFAVTGVSAQDQEAEEKISAALQKFHETHEPAGESEDCLTTYKIDSSRALDDEHIVFRTRAGDIYLNTLDSHCPQLGFEDSFSYTLHGLNKLCDLDTITVITPANMGATCGLGDFVKYNEKTSEE